MKLAKIDVATTLVYGPSVPIEGMSSRGRSRLFIQKIPSGGIHAVRRICSTVIVDRETYSTAAVQKIVRIRLMRGTTRQPISANNIWDSDGT
jgi:hypothetical protein